MKTFEYEASAVDGRTVSGRTWATSELDLDRDLETRGLTLLRAQQVVARGGGRHYRIDAAELINLTTQLATVVGAGVRLVEGLQGIGPRLATPQGRLLVEDMVSRKHARILHTETEFTIEDLGSTNGTFVNGQRIDCLVWLASGDVIQLVGTVDMTAADYATFSATNFDIIA